ncbi:shTK domain protein [Ancylostoma duodenale]|uniref:ShTK domain protein n=1 Tax=Ancylostoma duodenale TaxID=51022 RepID=A0A0C2D098_9BILA|nr:shTK domain protein [Ancylostoma duodenale]
MFPFDQAAKDRAEICFKKPAQKQFAVETCPKTCRFCCLTPRFNCQDNPGTIFTSSTIDWQASPYPCQLVTKELCQLKEMRDLLVKNCPSKCGFCQENGKEEGGGEEGKNCPADNRNCANWVKNGFCDSTFYTQAQKKQTCGHACKLC